ncbi:hypothetical protein [Streptomyces sp. NPDC090083]
MSQLAGMGLPLKDGHDVHLPTDNQEDDDGDDEGEELESLRCRSQAVRL